MAGQKAASKGLRPTHTPGLPLANAPIPTAGCCQPKALQGALKHSQGGRPQSLGGHCSFPCFLVGARLCWCPLRGGVSPSLVEVLYRILLSFKVRFTGDSLSLCWLTRLSSLTWGLDLCNSVKTSLGLLIY